MTIPWCAMVIMPQVKASQPVVSSGGGDLPNPRTDEGCK